MEDTLISFQVAKLAKEKGFDRISSCFLKMVDVRNEGVSSFFIYTDGREQLESKHYPEKDNPGLYDRTISLNEISTNSNLFHPVYHYYKNNNHTGFNYFEAPTQSLLQKWLREVHKIHTISDCNHSGWFWEICKTNGTSIVQMLITEEQGYFETYEQALEAGLIEALKLIN